uniref:Protein Hook homolog 3 n=1 Tax=Myripristis murdjan TaxID=586833 RepID=A0A667WM53_9TELE
CTCCHGLTVKTVKLSSVSFVVIYHSFFCRFTPFSHVFDFCRDSVYFNDSWISRIKSEVGDNWRLKVSNLKKILKGILDYNQEVLGQQINDFTLPDVNLIGEHSDAAELGRMLQLILGCAVSCEQKQGELEKELLDVRSQNEELTSLADEAQSLKDEMDVLRLVKEVVELQNRLSEESKKADKMEFEYKRLKEKVDSLQKEKDRMRTERDSLKETIEELHCVQAQEGQLTSSLFPLSSEGSDSLAAEITTPEIREHLIRLQHENKMLKLAQEGSDNEKIALLQSLLEDANSRKNELETENRLINQRLMEGQSQVEELQKNLQEQGSKADDVSNAAPCMREKLRELNNELLKKNALIDDMEPKYNATSQRVEELEDALKKKDDDMKQMEERYKKYLEKAKSVIRTLDPKQNQGSGPEVQALKNQLQEKDRMLHSLEKEMDKTRSQRDYEEKLIVSAWYNMGMSLQKKAAEDRLANTGSGQSFLARQRQATSTRRSYPGHVQPATAR